MEVPEWNLRKRSERKEDKGREGRIVVKVTSRSSRS